MTYDERANKAVAESVSSKDLVQITLKRHFREVRKETLELAAFDFEANEYNKCHSHSAVDVARWLRERAKENKNEPLT